MTSYKGYKIISLGEYYEIKNKDGKWVKNAVSIADAKEKIDLIERIR